MMQYKLGNIIIKTAILLEGQILIRILKRTFKINSNPKDRMGAIQFALSP